MKRSIPRRLTFHRSKRSSMMRYSNYAPDFCDGLPPECNVVVRRLFLVFVLFSTAFVSCFVFYRAAESLHFRSSTFPHVYPVLSDISPPDSAEYRLEKVLKDAAMEDRTVILTTLNEAWAYPNSIIDLFLESFRMGDHTHRLLNHLVIIAMDEKAFKRCLVVHAHCFALVTKEIDLSQEAYFMSHDYLKMMWRRIDFLRAVLEMGYNFIFTDADIMWFRDPFPHFHLDADFQIACDHFVGSSEDVRNQPNGGFSFVKSNNRSIEFYKFWHSSREVHPGRHDQDVLNIIKYDPFLFEIGLKMRFLDTAYFGGICEPSKDLNEVCTMHANCCIGLESKIHDLRIILQDWKRYMSLPPNLKRSLNLSWRVPQNCSIKNIQQYYSPGPSFGQ